MDKVNMGAYLQGVDRLILKPSAGTSSGVGVMLFRRRGDIFVGNDGSILDSGYLTAYGDDFVLQEAVVQHEDLAVFNPDSVNTLRLVAYRSVVDERVHVLSALIRIGTRGAFVDNAHAGGKFAGIDPATGRLNDYVCDQHGRRETQFNGIDFKASTFVIPHWDKVVAAAEDICGRLLHHRYISLDLTVDSEGQPRLIEFNVSWTGFWASMFSGQTPLGDKADEIIEYCRRQMNKS